ncbi:hypothetical protein MRX96_011148 [Rhipicephalus microplus]
MLPDENVQKLILLQNLTLARPPPMNSTVVRRASDTERAVAAVLVSAELCISVLGNLLVLFVSLWDEHVKQHRSNLLVVSLAVTDLLTATLVMVPSVCALTNDGWPLDNPGFCTFHGIPQLLVDVDVKCDARYDRPRPRCGHPQAAPVRPALHMAPPSADGGATLDARHNLCRCARHFGLDRIPV